MKLWPTRRAAGHEKAMTPVQGGWLYRILESFSGAWQKNVVVDRAAVSAYWAVFACVTLIAGDIGKLQAVVMERVGKIWTRTELRQVLRRPNRYQTRVEFFGQWVISLLLHGNTYVLKQRDERGFVVALYILDPSRVIPLVAEDGSIYYQCNTDPLARVPNAVTVPASEIIHDRLYTLHHPLIGVSPIYACGVAAMQGLSIQNNSANFFANASLPGGIIKVPGAMDETKARELKRQWNETYGGENRGKTAVLADKMEYQPLTMNASDSQLIEQLKMTAEMVCACFHVPGYKIGVGQMPTVNNTAALNQQYYDQCLQRIIENMELRLDEGLELTYPYETWFDLKGLVRMDPESRYKSHSEAIKGGWLAPNEARAEEDMAPVDGGDTPYMQQQNYSLASLDRRDNAEPPTQPEPVPPAIVEELAAVRRLIEGLHELRAMPSPPAEEPERDVAAELVAMLSKELADAQYA